MTLNLTELRDEPLGTPTVRDGGRRTFNLCAYCRNSTMTDAEMALGDAADGESVFKIDVVGLSDEALDPGDNINALICSCQACNCPGCHKVAIADSE